MVSANVGAQTVTLRDDPLGRLYEVTGSTSGTTRTGYDGLDRIAEYDAAGAVLRRYIHGTGTDEPITWYEGSGAATRRFLTSDERGSIIAVTDSAGAILAKNAYDEYGIPKSDQAGIPVYGRFAYTGQTWLPELGMYYYKARLYSPTLGRFMQTDPIGIEGGVNLYAYVGNDPVNANDPLGLCANWHHGVYRRASDGGPDGPPLPGSYSYTVGCTFAPPDLDGGRGNGERGGGDGSNEEAQDDECVDVSSCLEQAAERTFQRFTNSIKITDTSYWHIFLYHGFIKFERKSQFYSEFLNLRSMNAIIGMIILGNIGYMQSHGTVRYNGMLPFEVGFGPSGHPTRSMTVIVRPSGQGTGRVVTAYPGG